MSKYIVLPFSVCFSLYNRALFRAITGYGYPSNQKGRIARYTQRLSRAPYEQQLTVWH